MGGTEIDFRLLGKRQTLAIVALLIAIAMEVRFYPQLTTWLYVLLSRRSGWDGSGLVYFQTEVVTPTGITLGLASVTLALLLGKRRPSAVAPWILASWVLNGVLLAISIIWYARMADKG